MANYFTTYVVDKCLPLSPMEVAILEDIGASCYLVEEGSPLFYVVAENELGWISGENIEDKKGLITYLTRALGLTCDIESMSELEGFEVFCLIIQQGLNHSAESVEEPYTFIRSSCTCSKIRADGFGGGLTCITTESIFNVSTFSIENWLIDLCNKAEGIKGVENSIEEIPCFSFIRHSEEKKI